MLVDQTAQRSKSYEYRSVAVNLGNLIISAMNDPASRSVPEDSKAVPSMDKLAYTTRSESPPTRDRAGA